LEGKILIPFKLSVITDEVSQDLETAARFAKIFDLNGVEIRTVWNRSPQDLLEKVDEIKKILKKYDLEVSAIASPFFKANIDSKEEYEKHLEILKKCISLAKSLDTDIIRGFTFWRKNSVDEYLDRIIEKFQKPLEIIESEGVLLGIENEPSTFVGDGRDLALFLDRLGSKNVKAVWDPGNDIWDPHKETPYPDGYQHVRNRIIHVHVKDGIRKGKGGEPEIVAVGEGEVDFLGQFRALKEDGYKGYLSLETHWRVGKQLSEDLVTRPGGEAFSGLGEYSSAVCMHNLLKILAKI